MKLNLLFGLSVVAVTFLLAGCGGGCLRVCGLLRERQGRITGYLLPGIFGHGVAETEEDALTLIGEAARRLPPEIARFFCPLTESSFHRKALQGGCHVIKVMNYMTIGPYEHPDEVWMPSVLY
jgi:hypothetical protein